MNTAALPMPQLCEIIDFENMKLVDGNVSAFTIDTENVRRNLTSNTKVTFTVTFFQYNELLQRTPLY